jgi:hypothetical protein
MVVLIVLIAVVGSVLKKPRLGRNGADHGEASRLRDEVRQLKERIQVLERVITDYRGSHDLDREIERLRDR